VTTGKRQPRIPTPSSTLVPAKEAARLIGISYTTWRMIATAEKDQLPLYKFGRLWYFKRSDLALFIERHREARA
jgi:excisionase family DNA binding protein